MKKMGDDVISIDIKTMAEELAAKIGALDLHERVAAINSARMAIHAVSPFSAEPVDFVQWVPMDTVGANEYNPNSVAPPEMELLRLSIEADGYTQPIVANREDGNFVVVDGFHRHRVGKECADINRRIKGYLPVVQIRAEQVDLTDRMASTIRHNRARGKHKVEAMSDIVIELKRRNWSDLKISKQLGMDQDEILRLCQISGLAEIFSGQAFSQAWEASGHITPDDFIDISGRVEDQEDDGIEARTANTNDDGRIFHTFDQWECVKAGFYEMKPPPGKTADQCRAMYRDFLADPAEFGAALQGVTSDWVKSCEHYLTNSAMNRIAWLGQAAMCYATGVPSEYRGGYSLLTEQQQKDADALAFVWLNKWLKDNGREFIPMDQASPDRQSDIY